MALYLAFSTIVLAVAVLGLGGMVCEYRDRLRFYEDGSPEVIAAQKKRLERLFERQARYIGLGYDSPTARGKAQVDLHFEAAQAEADLKKEGLA